jgi:hypothetical protein
MPGSDPILSPSITDRKSELGETLASDHAFSQLRRRPDQHAKRPQDVQNREDRGSQRGRIEGFKRRRAKNQKADQNRKRYLLDISAASKPELFDKEENTTDYLCGVIGLSCHRMEDRSATSRQGFLHEVA